MIAEKPNMLEYESRYRNDGYQYIAGIDEAGRGPLAGPVVVASVIMPLDDIIEGINDSKQLSEKKRELYYPEIISKAISYKIVAVPVEVIEEINILEATKQGMTQCALGLEPLPDKVLIDAVKLKLPMSSEGIIKGDCLSYSIACASVLAKVYRDHLMLEYDKLYPMYNFAKHKGYGTREHIEAIGKYGACPIHRMSFMRKFLI